MEEHGGTWLSDLHLGFHPPHQNSPSVHQNLPQSYLIPGLSHTTDMFLKNGTTLPVSDSQCWFSSLPHFQPPVEPALYSIYYGEEVVTPKIESGFVSKRFLVVDQCKDRTTLMFSSGVGTAIQCLTSSSPNFPSSCLNIEEQGLGRDSNLKTNAILSSELCKDVELGMESEMHEDTEELNALLYSDDNDSDYEDEDEDDDVTSTGHSPNNGAEEEIASSFGPSMVDDFGSSKDREENKDVSRCRKRKTFDSEEGSSFSSNKKMRREKMQQTVNVLQSIIPGSHGKEAMEVLDEAIHYLKSLKLKAMAAIGLNKLETTRSDMMIPPF